MQNALVRTLLWPSLTVFGHGSDYPGGKIPLVGKADVDARIDRFHRSSPKHAAPFGRGLIIPGDGMPAHPRDNHAPAAGLKDCLALLHPVVWDPTKCQEQ
jgi:hypothetical protein